MNTFHAQVNDSAVTHYGQRIEAERSKENPDYQLIMFLQNSQMRVQYERRNAYARYDDHTDYEQEN